MIYVIKKLLRSLIVYLVYNLKLKCEVMQCRIVTIHLLTTVQMTIDQFTLLIIMTGDPSFNITCIVFFVIDFI